MSSYSYISVEELDEPVLFLSNEKSRSGVAGMSESHALFMSRLDFDCKIITVPPVADEEIGEILRYKIRSLYPGDPEHTVFDFKIFQTLSGKTADTEKSQGAQKQALVFITKKETINRYRTICGGKLLFLPYCIIKPLFQKIKEGRGYFIFWHQKWFEIFTIENGILANSTVYRRGLHVSSDCNKLKKAVTRHETTENHTIEIYCAEEEKDLLEATLADSFQGLNPEVSTFTPLFQKNITRQEALFVEKSELALPKPRTRMIIMGCLCLLLAGLLYVRYGIHRSEYAASLESTHGELLLHNRDITAVQSEVLELEKKILALQEKTPVSLSLFFSELSRELGSSTLISNININRNDFQIEATGPDPLKIEQALRLNTHFSNIEILEIKPLSGENREYFRMRGRFANVAFVRP